MSDNNISIGTVEITIRIRFDQDLTEQQMRKFIDELNYEVSDTTGIASIADSEIISDDLDERITMAKINSNKS